MSSYIFFVIAAVVLAGILYAIWRLWSDYARLSPEDEELERSIASLNDNQANRISDRQLTRNIDTDTGWEIMVRRGAAQSERRPSSRPRRPRR